MYLLGYDVGSSSIKASIMDADSGAVVAAPRELFKAILERIGGLWYLHRR